MRVFVPQDIYLIDSYSAECGVSVIELMGNAGKCLADVVAGKLNRIGGGKVLAVCGGGNNGGDGVAAAVVLKSRGVDTDIIICSHGKLTEATDYYRLKAVDSGIKIIDELASYSDYSVIIDAVAGIGLRGKADGRINDIIRLINTSGAYVVSADIPSGINGYNGRVGGAAVKADCVVAFAGTKTGHLLNDAKDYYEELVTIGIGEILPEEGLSRIYTADTLNLPKRRRNSHKGDYASVRIVGGAPAMTGAPLMSLESAHAALRSGAGIVKLGVSDKILPAYQARVKECMLYGMESNADGSIAYTFATMDGLLKGADVIALGMGMPVNDDLKKMIKHCLAAKGLTVVLDAGALSCVDKEDLAAAVSSPVITPHPLEFSRLSGYSLEQVLDDGLSLAVKFAAECNCVVNLKGSASIITDGKITYIDSSGTPAMAKGGSGDVLSGVTAAFCGVMDTLSAAAYAAHVCSLAAVAAERELGEHSVIASDVIAKIPYVLKG